MTTGTTARSHRIDIVCFWKSLTPLRVVASVAILSAVVAPAGAQTGNTVTECAKLLASDGTAGDSFGISVAISGDSAIVGSLGDDSNGSLSGSAYIFVKGDNGAWTQQAKLPASDAAAGDEFGFSVAINGDTAVVGALKDDDHGTNSGSAYVFVRDAEAVWTQQAKLLAADGAAGDQFGVSVAISGDTAIVGATGADGNVDDSGATYVFVRDARGAWTQQTKLLASDGAVFDNFGVSVAINGDTAVIGAPENDNACPSFSPDCNMGSAYVFVRDASRAWSQQAELLASDGAANDAFGSAVAIDGDTAVIGAIFNHGLTFDTGSAYVFVRDAAGVWTQQDKLLDSDGQPNDLFGSSVALSGGMAVVGARFDDDLGSASGSACVFARDLAGVWTQRFKILPSDGDVIDQFGSSVAFSRDTAVVGAIGDDDNGANSGAAYSFYLPAQPLPADLNSDGVVNSADLAIVLSVWGTGGSGTNADLNNDGVVNGADLAALLANWGHCNTQ